MDSVEQLLEEAGRFAEVLKIHYDAFINIVDTNNASRQRRKEEED